MGNKKKKTLFGACPGGECIPWYVEKLNMKWHSKNLFFLRPGEKQFCPFWGPKIIFFFILQIFFLAVVSKRKIFANFQKTDFSSLCDFLKIKTFADFWKIEKSGKLLHPKCQTLASRILQIYCMASWRTLGTMHCMQYARRGRKIFTAGS